MFTRETPNVKREMERKVKKMPNFDLLGGWGARVNVVMSLLQKAHPCVNPRRLSHFASKLVGGSDLQAPGMFLKKVRKSQTPIQKTCRR